MILIKEYSPIWSWISDRAAVADCLAYDRTIYKPTRFGKKKKLVTYKRSLVSKKGFFLSGFLDRVEKHLSDSGIRFKTKRRDYGIAAVEPKLPGIEFREDQVAALLALCKRGRGVWQAPTGSGKTIVICGLVAAFCEYRALIIVHTADLFEQTYKELCRFWPGSVGRIGCGKHEENDVTVAMIQTLDKMELTDGFCVSWPVLIVDEVHHVSKFANASSGSGRYDRVLRKILAPMRFGVTATLPHIMEAKFAMEGLIGPVVGNTTYEELQGCGVLADPIVKLVYVPETDIYKDVRGGYAVVYEEGIVRNAARNSLVVETALKYLNEGLTVLIMVERVAHGHELLKLCEVAAPGAFVYLHGETDSAVVAAEKEAFIRGDRRGVIATRIWSEGTNIRTVGAVINAAGGVSEIAVLQRFGRGLRSTDTKKSVYLVDFFDSNHVWFLRHSGKRVCMYFEQGWL